MKNRTIKKNVNRFITPVIKDLPTTIYGAFEVEEDGKVKIVGHNQIIVNGEMVKEGQRYNGCQDILRNIRLTGELAAVVIERFKEVHLRKFDIRGNRVYLRLITE